ncbi:MAG: pilin [Planctomycetota bacterium]|jgi:prepilin-type N-terminal cleavage/methylation domain-containing protein
MKSKLRGFTLIETMVVILIVSVLAAVAIPLMRGRVDRSKWAEANAAAGTIRSAVKIYFMENGDIVTGNLGDASVQQTLGIQSSDLTGSYFTASDYEIDSVSADGIAVITATGSQTNAPSGSKTLALDGSWE